MKMIVGLGNPGAEYKGTRHNLGFEVVDELARRWNATLKPWRSLADVTIVKERGVLLVKPRTFMNLSGEAAGQIARYHDIDPQDVLVIADEVQLSLGKLKLKPSGSAGGHNGLQSVIDHLGADFPRLRIGIERGDRSTEMRHRVLSRFSAPERDVIARAVTRAADAAETFAAVGLMRAMNQANAPADQTSEEDVS